MDSADAYEVHAREFLRLRDESHIGVNVVDSWARALQCGASVIELGCGGGYPITLVLRAVGLRLCAIDSSETLALEFQSRFPDIPIQCGKVQECNFFEQTYDGAVAIGLVFLLTELEQLELISSVAKILRPGGRFLFTAPIEKGSWLDMVTGLSCTSLGLASYEAQIQIAGLSIVTTFSDSGGNHYFDVERVG